MHHNIKPLMQAKHMVSIEMQKQTVMQFFEAFNSASTNNTFIVFFFFFSTNIDALFLHI